MVLLMPSEKFRVTVTIVFRSSDNNTSDRHSHPEQTCYSSRLHFSLAERYLNMTHGYDCSSVVAIAVANVTVS